MSELTRYRIIEKRNLEPFLELWKDFEWLIEMRDDFGGLITGTYKPGPALLEVLRRLNVVIELTTEEKKEIERLEHADPKQAQDRLNELVGAKANMFYSSLNLPPQSRGPVKSHMPPPQQVT